MESKRKYSIKVIGCDDSTKFDMMLSDSELSIIREMCDLSRKHSEYGCQPIICIEIAKEE